MNINDNELQQWKAKLRRVAKKLEDLLDMYNANAVPIQMILDVQAIQRELRELRDQVFTETEGEANDKSG